jgi:3-methyladenine DNA glycosylase AlkD
MKISEVKTIGESLAQRVSNGDMDTAISLLNPILADRTPFSALDRIGGSLVDPPLDNIYTFLDRLASDRYMGGWVVIGSALREQLDRDFNGTLSRCKKYIILSDIWYGADILGERVPGPALLPDFNNALNILSAWRKDSNRWVRRAVGVSVHYRAKKSKGSKPHTKTAVELLNFMAPMFTEWEMDAAKGIGWGLKTLGKFYPDILTNWLKEILSDRQMRYRAIMVRKSITYLPESNKVEILNIIS